MKHISLPIEEIVQFRIKLDDEEKPQAALNENPYLSGFSQKRKLSLKILFIIESLSGW
ncbi:hypothetical protein WN51_04876 [Melipona quadrifasciata]|uniref:Uncharacterized protein n=1 Tax=Melipona quadrifasciata TaxID=166423 RepID=A0A0M8ZUA6_9HYME|nr:hypothetical protein WN51_04876 [Melipona quadrifasciata]